MTSTGFRLPESTHIGRVTLQVSDLARSVSWYERVLGLVAHERAADRASLGPPSESRAIVELRERKDARRVPSRGLLGLYHFAILVPDRPSLGRFLAHLAGTGERAGMSDHLVSEAIYINDPDGLGIEIYADRPRESWRWENGEIAMSTKPLDADDLIAAGGEEPWRGMPAGTVIGHVHFHVGSIDDASTFYNSALGFDPIVSSYPGALFMSAGGYHHHVATNTWARGAPPASDEDAKLLEWELVLPTKADVDAAARSVADSGFETSRTGDGATARDPWGIQVRLRAA